MRYSWTYGWALLLVILLTIMPTAAAYAYLDPGSGSLIVQIIIAGILGLLIAIKLQWTRITGFITRRKPETDADEPDSDAKA